MPEWDGRMNQPTISARTIISGLSRHSSSEYSGHSIYNREKIQEWEEHQPPGQAAVVLLPDQAVLSAPASAVTGECREPALFKEDKYE